MNANQKHPDQQKFEQYIPNTMPPKPKNTKGKVFLGVGGGILGLVLLGNVMGGGNEPTSTTYEADSRPAAVVAQKEDVPAKEDVPVREEVPAEPAIPISQQQAVKKAESYLSFSSFSRLGLIDQLEYEDFSTEDATYAVDNVEVDWNEQAAKKAESYLDHSSFSRQGLIDQLQYEKFTPEQAVYGVNSVGL